MSKLFKPRRQVIKSTVFIPAAIDRRIKAHSKKRGLTKSGFIVDLLQRFFESIENEQKYKHT